MLQDDQDRVDAVLKKGWSDSECPAHFSNDDKSNANSNIPNLVGGLGTTDLMAFARAVIGDRNKRLTDNPATALLLRTCLVAALQFGVRPELIQELAAATALARSPHDSEHSLAKHMASTIRDSPHSTWIRRTEILIATAELAILDSRTRATTIDDLRTYWHEETEPESKLVLAELIIAGVVEIDKWRPILRPGQ